MNQLKGNTDEERLADAMSQTAVGEIEAACKRLVAPWWKRIFTRRPKTPWLDAMAKAAKHA